MSGGHWDYVQYRLTDVIDELKGIVSGEIKTTDWSTGEEVLERDNYTQVTLEAFKRATKAIEIAQTHIQRIDWLLSGDDSEESYYRRLHTELEKFEYDKV